MSVKLTFNSGSPIRTEVEGGFCYCRRNAPMLAKKPASDKSLIDLCGQNSVSTSIDFGSIPVESSEFHEVVVVSPAGSNAIELHEGGVSIPFDPAFRIVTSVSSSLPCMENRNLKNFKQNFRVYFEPSLPGMHYAQVFELIMVDGEKQILIQICCRGDSFGPAICLSENQINFGGQYYQDETRRRVKLNNLSACDANFQFDVDNTRSAFKVCPTAGVIPAYTVLNVEISFHAPKPQAYYKRILCFILHQQPQFLDLVGVCIPRPFIPPQTGIDFGISTFQTQFLPLPSQSSDEFFESDHCWGIHLSSDQIDFGYAEVVVGGNPVSESEPLSFSSNLPYDVVLEWSPDPSEVFLVAPMSAILPAGLSTLFHVKFHPTFPNTFYNGQLECFAHPTGHNWSPEFGPPWAAVTAVGVVSPDTVPQESMQNLTVEVEEVKNLDTEVVNEVVALEKNIHESSKSEGKSTQSVRNKAVKNKDKNNFSKQPKVKKSKKRPKKKVEEEEHEEAELELEYQEVKNENDEIESEIPMNPIDEPLAEPVLETLHNPFTLTIKMCHLNHSENPRYIILPPLSVESEMSGNLTLLRNENKVTDVETIQAAVNINTFLSSETWHQRTEGRTSRMPQELGLPLPLNLRVFGHTHVKAPLVNHFKFPTKIPMETTWPMNKVCRTICFKNEGDLPVHVDASAIEEHGVYRVKPNKCVIPGNFHQLLLVSMMPKSPQPLAYIQNSKILLNLRERNKITLLGLAEQPWIDIILCYEDENYEDVLSENENEGIVFPMTVPNLQSEVLMQLINPTRYYVKFAFSPTHQLKNETTSSTDNTFGVNPASGFLLPFERVDIKWTFLPAELATYAHEWNCVFNVKKGRVEPIELLPYFEFKFSVSGVGESCQVEASPTTLDFGFVEIYKKETKSFTVTNRGNAVVKLYFKALHMDWLENFPTKQLVINPPTVNLGRHESAEIQVTVRPNMMSLEQFHIIFSLIPKIDLLEYERSRLCYVRFLGDHPVLKVTDINHTSLHPICSSGFSWSMFSIKKLNKFLGSGSDKHAFAQEGKMRIPPIVTFNFPSAPIGSEAAIFTLLLTNTGKLGTIWELYGEPPKQLPQFLKDDEFQTPFDGDNPTESNYLCRLWSRRIIDNYQKVSDDLKLDYSRERNICFNVKPFRDVSLFKVCPQSGSLKPKEMVQISFRFIYKTVGFHDMYFLLRVNPTIFVWIRLKGRTLNLNIPCIQHFYEKEFTFLPVALSNMDPPIQLVWMYNGGNSPANFFVHPKPFLACKNENYGQEVFELVNKRGVILPRSWGAIKIRFSPIEMLDYKLDMTVKWDGGESLIKLHGTPLLRQPTLLTAAELGVEFADGNYRLTDISVPLSITPSQVTIQQVIPTGHKHTTLIFLTNLSEHHQITFSWPENTETDGGSFVNFQPHEGTVPPNGEVACEVRVTAGSVSITVTSLIRCTLTDETVASESRNRVKKWETCKSFLLCHKMNELETEARLLKKYGSRPEAYERCSKVFSLSFCISTAFGMADSTETTDKIKRLLILPCKPLLSRTPYDILQIESDLMLPPFARQLCRELLSPILWEIFHSDSFENLVKLREAWMTPLFLDYKASSDDASNLKKKPQTSKPVGETKEAEKAGVKDASTIFPLYGSNELLKEVIFDLLKDELHHAAEMEEVAALEYSTPFDWDRTQAARL